MRLRLLCTAVLVLATVASGPSVAGATPGPITTDHQHSQGGDEHAGHTAVDPAQRAKRPRLTVPTRTRVVKADRVVKVVLACSAATRCRGVRWLTFAGTRSARVGYDVPRRSKRTVSFRLTAQQYQVLKAARTRAAAVGVRERKPVLLPARASTLTLTAYGVPPVVPVDPIDPVDPVDPVLPPPSEAYAHRNWTPTAFDTCSETLHRAYSTVGPDGKLYPTWHPAVVTDPITGTSCTFGHEHGDDPASSNIADWVETFLASPEHPDQRGIPFGYVSERLTEYAGANAAFAVRHEDNVGHKVIVANDVKLVSDNPRGYVRFTDGNGASQIVTCNYLIKIHQGSHSADATANNAHELIYAMKCNDGSAVISSTMTRFGDPNEFKRSCDPSTKIDTVGSVLPPGDGGDRLIPDRWCIEKYVLVDPNVPSAHTDPWGIYEVWRSVNTLTAEDGRTLASFDPWFGVRNPSRYFQSVQGATNTIGRPLDAAWETEANGDEVNADPWLALDALLPFSATDPRSPFDGAERDFYLAQSSVSNASGQTLWYTDPYGRHGTSVPFAGSVPQFVSSTANTYPALERRIFDKETDFGAGLGVHAPN